MSHKYKRCHAFTYMREKFYSARTMYYSQKIAQAVASTAGRDKFVILCVLWCRHFPRPRMAVEKRRGIHFLMAPTCVYAVGFCDYRRLMSGPGQLVA